MPENAPKDAYDVVVIGTGMGGSAAGAICAGHGLKTLILEKNQRVGGSCSWYEKQGFTIDMGSHLFIRGNKGPFGECTRRLGMGTPLEFRHTNPMTEFRGLNFDMTIPGAGLFSMLVLGVRAFRQFRLSPFDLPGLIKLNRDLMRTKEPELETLDDITFDEFIRRYTKNPYILSLIGFLMDLYFVLSTRDIAAGEAIWNIQKMVKTLNLGYPKGGAAVIPKTFLNGGEKLGARLMVNAGVKKITVADGRVTGVVMKNGEKIAAKAVISTTAVKDTILKLTGPENFSPDYVEKVHQVKSSMIAVQAKIALNRPLVRAGSLVGGIRLPADRFTGDVLHDTYDSVLDGRVPEFDPIYAPVPSNYDPELAPEGCQLITACALCPTLEVAWKDDVSLWMDKMMDSLREMVPGLDDHMIFCDLFSIRALANWIGKSSGAAITTGQTTGQVASRRPPHQTPITGLYIAGDGAGRLRGVGTELACQSGMNCADLVAADIGRGALD